MSNIREEAERMSTCVAIPSLARQAKRVLMIEKAYRYMKVAARMKGFSDPKVKCKGEEYSEKANKLYKQAEEL